MPFMEDIPKTVLPFPIQLLLVIFRWGENGDWVTILTLKIVHWIFIKHLTARLYMQTKWLEHENCKISRKGVCACCMCVCVYTHITSTYKYLPQPFNRKRKDS